MIQQQTRLRVADNTGARVIQCIRIMGRSRATTAEVGDVIVASASHTVVDLCPVLSGIYRTLVAVLASLVCRQQS